MDAHSLHHQWVGGRQQANPQASLSFNNPPVAIPSNQPRDRLFSNSTTEMATRRRRKGLHCRQKTIKSSRPLHPRFRRQFPCRPCPYQHYYSSN